MQIAWFFGGAFLANAIPHLVAGTSGRAFPTPFAQPRGRGESSALFNVVWAALNIAAGYGLIFQIGQFDLRALADVATAASGAFLLALILAWRFGAQYGGNRPARK